MEKATALLEQHAAAAAAVSSPLSISYLVQQENFEYLVLMKKLELFIPWWLENRVRVLAASRCHEARIFSVF